MNSMNMQNHFSQFLAGSQTDSEQGTQDEASMATIPQRFSDYEQRYSEEEIALHTLLHAIQSENEEIVALIQKIEATSS
jgi:hypothetical protein